MSEYSSENEVNDTISDYNESELRGKRIPAVKARM